MIEARATHDDFEPKTIETLEILELTHRGELWPETKIRKQLVAELVKADLVQHVQHIPAFGPKGEFHGPERYKLTDAGVAKARELQQTYRSIVNHLHFDPLPNLNCTLRAASSTVIGGPPEPMNTTGIHFRRDRASLWTKRLPGVTLSTTPEGIWMVTSAIGSYLDVHCKTVGRELHLSAGFAGNQHVMPWGHRSIGWTLSLIPPTEMKEEDKI